jgi:hypothetical protein
MSEVRRIFLPVFGIATILTLAAISSWVSSGKKVSDGFLLGGAVALVWFIVIFIRRKKRDDQ